MEPARGGAENREMKNNDLKVSFSLPGPLLSFLQMLS